MIKPRVIYNFRFLPKGVRAITLYPFILTPYAALSDETLRHEMVHVAQVERLGWFRFYASYLGYYLVNLVKYRNHQEAYRNIPYEMEAYGKADEFKAALEQE